MRYRSRLFCRALVAAGIASLISIPAQPASADLGKPASGADRQRAAAEDARVISGLTPESLKMLAAQERLDLLAERIRSAAISSATNGVSGIVVDADHNTLQVYWHGAVPGAVSNHIANARTQGMKVVVQSAPFTEAQLLQEADRISQLPLFKGAPTGQRTMRVGPKADGTGLNVGISGLPANVSIAQAREHVPALASNVPLAISAVDPVIPSSRLFDFPAFWGGSFIHNRASGYTCTSAFGVTGNNGAATYLLTAAHCGTGTWGSYPYVDGNGNVTQDVYGATIAAGRSTQLDAELIHTPGGAGGRVYWGSSINPPNGDPGALSGVAVGGSSANNFGDSVCMSGSYSGTICPSNSALIRIRQVNQTITFNPPANGVGRITGLVHAEHALGQAINGQGDSGGPVVSVRASDGKLLARGVNSAFTGGSYLRPCVGWAPAGRQCAMDIFYGDVRAVMNTVGVRINTA